MRSGDKVIIIIAIAVAITVIITVLCTYNTNITAMNNGYVQCIEGYTTLWKKDC